MNPTTLLLAFVLFVLLSPGILVTLPGKGPLLYAVLVHACIFTTLMYVIPMVIKVEGFSHCEGGTNYYGGCKGTKYPTNNESCGTSWATNGKNLDCWSNNATKLVKGSCVTTGMYSYKCPVYFS